MIKQVYILFILIGGLYSCGQQQKNSGKENPVDSSKKETKDSLRIKDTLDLCNTFKDTAALSILKEIGFCVCGTQSEVDKTIQKDTSSKVYGACDPDNIKLFKLNSDNKNPPLYLVEIRRPMSLVGTGGYHNYVVQKENGVYKKINFFQGYVDTVKYNKPYYNIIFEEFDQFHIPETYRQYYQLQLSWSGDKYTFKKLLKVYNRYYINKDSTIILKKYDPEFDSPKHWKYLSEQP
jgi:hypothetical protein